MHCFAGLGIIQRLVKTSEIYNKLSFPTTIITITYQAIAIFLHHFNQNTIYFTLLELML